MIRYPITLKSLNAAVDKVDNTWRQKAKQCTDTCKKAKKYVDQGSIWTDIKRVYLELQFHKCVYCERELASTIRINADGTKDVSNLGSIEHDVEHFRPKSSVKQWPTKKIASTRQINYKFPLGAAASPGYYLLAFNVLNYATSCKTCNTPLKGNYFPVQGRRRTAAADPAKIKSEKHLLVYAISDIDIDPEDVFTFDGWLIKPVHANGESFRRALVTIDFFELDTREELIRERAKDIVTMFLAFENVSSSNATARDIAKRTLARHLLPHSRHTNCCRAYFALLKSNHQRATELANKAETFLQSES